VKPEKGRIELWLAESGYSTKFFEQGGEIIDSMEMFELWLYVWSGYAAGSMSFMQTVLHF